MKKINLVGKRFSRLVVLSETDRQDEQVRWLCVCDCGKETKIKTGKLNDSHTRSCGCLQKETTASTNRTHGYAFRGNKNREYAAWINMKARCFNPNNDDYSNYGGRGITVCLRWKTNFKNFFKDMGKKPNEKMSLERLNPNKNYSPSNCCWATSKQQANNSRRNRSITFNGQTKTLAQWSEFNGVTYDKLRHRLNRGWPIKKAFTN